MPEEAEVVQLNVDAAPLFSEEDLALRFAEMQATRLRYVAKWNSWYIFDGKRWTLDETRKTWSLARVLCRAVANTINKPKEQKAMASAKVRAAVVSLSGEDRRIAATVAQWDADPWLLNTPNGVVDLRTGNIRPALANDYMTKITAVAPNSNCATPLWSQFLDKVTAGNADLQKYLARVFGYGLTGLTIEHALFFLYGEGGNGKSVFLNTVADVLGDYHRTAPIETFTDAMHDRHPTELAMLRGARLVTATETEEGRRWAESRIKMLTGGEKISARFMRQDFFEYVPQFKLGISGNHKPGLRSVDEAIKRRMNLIPFTVTIPREERDPNFRARLKPEWPGILAWLVAGCRQWQAQGLAAPDVVVNATNAYLDEEDAVKLWLEENCFREAQRWITVAWLFSSWKYYAEAAGEHAGSTKRFSQRLESLGFKRGVYRNKRVFFGIGLLTGQANNTDHTGTPI